MSTPTGSRCRSAMTVLLGDPGAVGDRELQEARSHAARCPRCASALDDPGAAQRVLAGLGAHRPSRRPWLRPALTGLSLVQLVVGVPWLFGASGVTTLLAEPSTAHLARDGALGIAVGTAGMAVALRPRFARPMLAVCLAVLAMHLVAGAVDERAGDVPLHFELAHLPALAVISLVALSSVPERVVARRERPAPLRSVR